MPTPLIPAALTEAGGALRHVLLRLDSYARTQVQRLDSSARYAPLVMAHVSDLQALLTAVEQYEQAVLASLPSAPLPLATLTTAELLAHRQADPVYRLGYVRGYQRGLTKGQRAAEPALSLYAQHAALPAPMAPAQSYTALVAQVRSFLAQMSQRYGAGPITRPYYAPPAA
jgi:hypothetical protein